jgi:predicted MFS family arabinose efflux permease
VGSSVAILGVFKVIRMTFAEERFARMLSFSVMIGLIGAIYGGGPVNYMRDAFGYQTVVYMVAAGGIALALLSYLIIPDIGESPRTKVREDLKEVLSNPRVIWSCIFAGMMVGPLEGFADVWGTIFLKEINGFDGVLAAGLPSTIFVGMCFGAPFLSFVAERFKNYLLTIFGAGIFMAVGFILFLSYKLSPSLITLSFVIVGICSAYQILAIYKASTYVREHLAGLTTAVANMIIMIFGYGFHTVIGNVVNAMGGPKVPQALFYGISVIPVALCLGAGGFALLFLWEKRSEKALQKSTEAEF